MRLYSEYVFAKRYSFGCNFCFAPLTSRYTQNYTVSRFCACRGHKQSRHHHIGKVSYDCMACRGAARRGVTRRAVFAGTCCGSAPRNNNNNNNDNKHNDNNDNHKHNHKYDNDNDNDTNHNDNNAA